MPEILAIRTDINAVLEQFLDHQRKRLATISPELAPISQYLSDFLSGGKRLRPTFAYWGWCGAGGAENDQQAITAAAALEWIQTCALIHDDVMDASDTRRGKPTAHRAFSAMHQAKNWRGNPDDYGTSIAILLGDFCLIWADEMVRRAGFAPHETQQAWSFYDEMRTEVMAGQYLDLASQSTGEHSVARAMRVVRYKSAKYTIERPLHFGGALAGATPEVLEAYTKYGIPLGEAFQLRDDVLGVFGNPTITGKPAGDDLREGKRTVLVALAIEQTDQAGLSLLKAHLGNADMDEQTLNGLREVIVASGALAHTEQLIENLTSQALAALDNPEIEPKAAKVLQQLVIAATKRQT